MCTRIIRGIFSPKKPWFETNFGQWVEIYSTIAKGFWQNCQNCILNLHGIKLMEIIFFDHRVFDSFWNTEQKDISLLAESFQQACQDGILRVQRNFSRRKKQPFECFETLAKIFLPLARKLISRIVKTAIYAPKWISWWDFDSEKICLFSFLDIELKVIRLLAKLFRNKYQNCNLSF